MIFARLMLGEVTSPLVNVSLLPVVGGLALVSATELSFHTGGFLAAVPQRGQSGGLGGATVGQHGRL